MTASRSFITSVSSTSGLTTYTFSGVSLGAPSSDRQIIICAESRKTAGALCEIVACSIGGVAATVVAQQASAPTGTANYAGIASAIVPAGETGDVSITFSVAQLRCGLQVYSLAGASVGAHRSAASLADNPSVALEVPAGGIATGCLSVASSQAFDWVGLSQDHSAIVGGSLRTASASAELATAEAAKTMGVIRTSGTWSTPVGVFASWGPAAATEPSLARKRRLVAARRKYRV